MLSFFRRILHSKAGIVITFVALGVIALAFAMGDITGIRGGNGGGLSGNTVAKVGGIKIADAELRTRVTGALDGARQQQPTLTIDQFLGQGALEGILEQLTGSIALTEFGRDQGMAISKRTVDGQIASIPAFQGPTGQFDQTAYERILADRRLTDAGLRADFARDAMAQLLVAPTIGATLDSRQIALPYASLLLEKRRGQVGFVPTAAMGTGAAPTDAELQAFYTRNRARYTVPERRVIRYALVTPALVAGRAVPTDAEVAQAYRGAGARYAASETRTIAQVVAADQATAASIAAKVKGGASVADAARAAGLEASTAKGVARAAYAGTTSSAIADQVFAAARGATIGPVRAPIGFIVAHVDAIEQVPAKTLEQARPEIVAALTKDKSAAGLNAIRDKLDDGLSNNATFDEAVADQKLNAETTQPLTAGGTDPDAPAAKPDPALAPIVTAAFQAAEGDAPQLVATGQDGSFAIVALSRVVAAAPRPLAQIRDQVARDFTTDRARAAARVVAGQIVAAVNKGTPLDRALAGSGRSLPPAKPASAARSQLAQLAQNPGGAPPPLVLMFSMAKGTAKLLEAPNNGGWYVVALDEIVPGNAASQPAMIVGAQRELGATTGREYAQQFARAVRDAVGVRTDAAAVARVRADLTGASGTAGN